MNNLFKNAINFYENKEYDKAKKVCEDILDIQPDDLNATNLLAILNFHNKDFLQSIKFCWDPYKGRCFCKRII